ncbi:MAG TPA: DNA-binding protein, partial [Myxococcaceae bacterium]|nr:DNA-binding protein [Myxococcaceae bacterium]
ELWSAPGARVLGAPAIHPEGRRIAFAAKEGARSNLYVVNADGTQLRLVTGALQLRGAPAWTPDGQSITVAALSDGAPRLHSVPLDGGPASLLISEHSVDPAWSSDGKVLLFTGPDVGTTFPAKAVKADGTPYPLPPLTLTRGARHLRFLMGDRSIALLRGEMRHKNLSVIDLQTGAEQRVVDLPPQFDVRDFDLSPDGRELVLEQIQEYADIVLIDLPRR